MSDMKNLIDKRLAISDYNFKPALTTYLIDPDIIPNYPLFMFEQTPHIICFNLIISDGPTAKRIEVACIKDGPTHLKLILYSSSHRAHPSFNKRLISFALHQDPTCSPLTRTETISLQTKYHFFLQKSS